MAQLEAFSSLIGKTYDAALDPSLWPAALQSLCEFVPGAYANIFVQDARNAYVNAVFTFGMEPRYFQSYLDRYARMNPLFPGIFFREVGEVFSVFDILPAAQFTRTRLYREWVAPQGVHDGIAAILDKSSHSSALLAIPLHLRQGRATAEMRRRVSLALPHIRRAVLIGKAFEQKRIATEDFAATIDSLAAGIFLLDAARGIAHANRSGLAMLEAGDALYRVGARLHARDGEINRLLGELFVVSQGVDAAAIGSRGVAILLPSRTGKPYVGHVLPLISWSRRSAAGGGRASACLVVHDSARGLSSSPELLAKAFRLTPREVAVLLALVEVGGIEVVAEMLGLSQTTVKTHLRQLFAKTGAARQAELVRLVAQFMTPVG